MPDKRERTEERIQSPMRRCVGTRFVPTGAVDHGNLRDVPALPEGGGWWMTASSHVRAGRMIRAPG